MTRMVNPATRSVNTSGIRNFFLRPSWPLIFFATCAIAASLFALRGAVMYANWKADFQEYSAWRSGEGVACAAIRKSCEEEASLEELDARESNKSGEAKSFYDEFVAQDSQYERRIEAYLDYVQRVENCTKPRISAAGLSCAPREEPVFSVEQVLASEIFLYPLFVPFLFLVMRRFYGVQHLGWRRVAIALSGMVALAMTYQVVANELWHVNPFETFFLFILLPVAVSLAIPSFVLDGYRWISEGFTREKGQCEAGETAKPGEPVERLPLSWASIGAVLKACGIAALLIAGLYFKPEATLAAGMVGAIAGAVVVVVGVIRKKLGK